MHVFKDIRRYQAVLLRYFLGALGIDRFGFCAQMVHLGVFRWGGAFGLTGRQWLVSYVNIIGTMAILFVTLVIFLIVTDPRFIDRCKAFGEWCKGLFKKKKPKRLRAGTPETPKSRKNPGRR